MTDIIQLLKDNEKPFGLMSKEMQEKANEINTVGMFVVYHETRIWVERTHPLLYDDCTYRLRPDYEEEPKYDAVEILDGELGLRFNYNNELLPLSEYLNCPFFAGFWHKPVYGEEIYTELWLNLDVEHNGNHKMTHATHVLFRGTP